MQVEVIVTNRFMTLWYHHQEKIVHHQYHQFMYGEPFRSGLLTGLEVLRTHGAQKWLSDNRKSSAVHPDDRLWVDENWLPLALSAGWSFWAIVLPQKVVGQMHMRDLAARYSAMGIITSLFTDPEPGMLWLRAQLALRVPADPQAPSPR